MSEKPIIEPDHGSIFGNNSLKGLKGVIAAADKILRGERDSETLAASTEEDHPIVKAKEEEEAAQAVASEGFGGIFKKLILKVTEDASNDESDDGEGLDKADPKAAKKKFKDRKDKDIDNDGDEDDSDEFLHKKRKAISKAVAKEEKEIVHVCAKHVEHAEWGEGQTISEQHDMSEDGVEHYDVLFNHGVEKDVPVESLMITEAHDHAHKEVKKVDDKIEKQQKDIEALKAKH